MAEVNIDYAGPHRAEPEPYDGREYELSDLPPSSLLVSAKNSLDNDGASLQEGFHPALGSGGGQWRGTVEENSGGEQWRKAVEERTASHVSASNSLLWPDNDGASLQEGFHPALGSGGEQWKKAVEERTASHVSASNSLLWPDNDGASLQEGFHPALGSGGEQWKKAVEERTASHISASNSLLRPDNDDVSLLTQHNYKALPQLPAEFDNDGAVALSKAPTTLSVLNRRSRRQGWRFGVALSASTAATVLLVNLILTIWATAHFPHSNGIGTSYTGSCDEVTSWARWLHIVINALSSILLSASNYTMQCLSSPTRKEVDLAHSRGHWLDIGVASVRNIRKISWRRAILWWFLAMSSIPIHLLYNSAIFKTLDANTYNVHVVSDDFWANGASWDPSRTMPSQGNVALIDSSALIASSMAELNNGQAFNTSRVQNLSSSDCITAYSTSFTTGRDNVFAVTSSSTGLNDTVYYFVQQDPVYSPVTYDWICADLPETVCNTGRARQNVSLWTINQQHIAYCLSELRPEKCKLQFSSAILAAVVLCNACKALCMLLTLAREKEAPLVTVGDAVASFLQHPDPTTVGRCLMGRVDVKHGPLKWAKGKDVLPVNYSAPIRRRWFAGPSRARWICCMTLCTITLVVAAILLSEGVATVSSYVSSTSLASLWALGFGAVDSRALIPIGSPGASGLVGSVLLANLAQLVLSALYLMYNGLYTCMLLAYEWSRHAVRRRHLRVSAPRAAQRSTYFLQLPYAYGLPLIVASATLHWLVSQSIFLARIDIYTAGVLLDGFEISEMGYSCAPLVCVIVLGSAMLLVALAFGARMLPSGIPVASSCSVAISAACHRPDDDVDAAMLPVMWGAVDRGVGDIGHVSFSSEEVDALAPGRMYAGARKRGSTRYEDT